MKKNITTLTITFVLFTMLTLLFVLTNDVKAQDNNTSSKVVIEKYEISKNAVKSIIMGIKSENEGLRKSSIFYAGQYKLEGAVDCLIEEFQKEKDSSTKILIALSLYKIGNPIAIDYMKDMVNNEKNTKVKDLLTAIYNDFVVENSVSTASK